MFDSVQEKFMQHEVRIRMLEQLARDTKNLLKWILAVAVGSVLVPMLIHYYHLA